MTGLGVVHGMRVRTDRRAGVKWLRAPNRPFTRAAGPASLSTAPGIAATRAAADSATR